MTYAPPALPARIADIVAEYDEKREGIAAELAAFKRAGEHLMMRLTVSGAYGREQINTGNVYERNAQLNLLRSAWVHIYEKLRIEELASAKDKNLFEQALAAPPEFTLQNIRATFGDYIRDPRGNILRGLAEVFCDLDPAYKSHDKVRIGVKGLPKRVILPSVNGYGWGRDRLTNVLNALAQVQGKPLVGGSEVYDFLKNGDLLKESRGVWLKRFANGNGHLFFDEQALLDINRGLAEYYGEVLPDAAGERPEKTRAGTAVSKDLQYYPTPVDVVERVLNEIVIRQGDKVLEPSCGCGRFMDALRKAGAQVYGVEYDAGRANIAKAKGHAVHIGNFLETVPTPMYDRVVMNPPFYGTHYAKHVEHALKFLKTGGMLTAILPVTARYDHGLLKGEWRDLPTGAFRESGTNINTTVLTMRA